MCIVNGRVYMRTRIFVFISIFFLCMGLCSYSALANDDLYEEIQKQAKQYSIAPQNAIIDKIWKATPGYNGKEVDIEASYNNMKKIGRFDEKQLVYREVSPSTHLEDLSYSPIYRGHPHKKW